MLYDVEEKKKRKNSLRAGTYEIRWGKARLCSSGRSDEEDSQVKLMGSGGDKEPAVQGFQGCRARLYLQ